MSVRGRLALLDAGGGREAPRITGSVWETLQDVQECSEGPPGCLEVVGRLSRKSVSGRESVAIVLV